MNQKEYDELKSIVNGNKWDIARKTEYFFRSAVVDQPTKQRTGAQNAGLHLGFRLIADALNDAGLDIRAVLKPDVEIPWTPTAVKEYLFRPVMKLLFNIESTTKLGKNEDVSKLWDVVMRHLQQKFGLDYIDFPHNESVGVAQLENLHRIDYPEYTGPPTI